MSDFTHASDKVIENTVLEAFQMGHGQIELEHLFLGLLRTRYGMSTQLLNQMSKGELGIVREEVKKQLELRHARAGTTIPPVVTGVVPSHTQALRHAMFRAGFRAKQRNHFIDPDHLLYGVVEETIDGPSDSLQAVFNTFHTLVPNLKRTLTMRLDNGKYPPPSPSRTATSISSRNSAST